MKKRILASLATIALASTLVGGATFALFTDSSTNNNNQFKAGTIDIEQGEQQYAIGIANMAPGDVISGSFDVKNAGSLQLRFDTTSNPTGNLFQLNANAATVTIDNPSHVVVDPGETKTVTYKVALPNAAGNEFQAATGDLSFTVNAEQTANN